MSCVSSANLDECADALLEDLRFLREHRSALSKYREMNDRFRVIVAQTEGSRPDTRLIQKMSDIYFVLRRFSSFYEHIQGAGICLPFAELEYNSDFPDSFWRALEEGNQNNHKRLKATCLVLHPKLRKPDLALSGIASRRLILDMSQKCGYRVFFRTVQSVQTIRCEGERVFGPIKTGKKCLFLNMHGNVEALVLADTEREWLTYSIHQIQPEDFHVLKPGGQVIIAACSSEQIAQKIARMSRVQATGMTANMGSWCSFIDECSKCHLPELIAMNPNRSLERMDCSFDQNGQKRLNCKKDIYFLARERLMGLSSDETQGCLGQAAQMISSLLSIPLNWTPREKIAWSSVGAHIGCPRSCLDLADAYAQDAIQNPSSNQKALQWLEIAADTNDSVDALVRLGDAYKYGGVGIHPKDLEKAAQYYRKAMKLGDQRARAELGASYAVSELQFPAQGFSEIIYCLKGLNTLSGGAAFLLAEAHWHGWGELSVDLNAALFLYQTAARLGHPVGAIKLEYLHRFIQLPSI